MEFRVLGRLELHSDDRPFELRRAKSRQVLALLLADANRTVPVERLRWELWGPRPPASQRANLQSYVWAIRQILVGDRLTHDRGGYRLRADDAERDDMRHDRLASAGRTAIARGDLFRGTDLLGRAVELWRGRPLEGLPCTPRLGCWVDALEQRHRLVVQDWTDARLRLGQSHELVGELRRAVAHDPLCERQHAQLMLALYRAGRPAEALDTYAGACRVLARELGVDPGPALSRIRRAILAVDPMLRSADPRDLCTA